MASRTVVDSVQRVAGPPANVEALEAELEALRERHPEVVLRRYLDKIPAIDPTAYLAPTAALVGDVTIGARASVWYGCVLRADVNRIELESAAGAGQEVYRKEQSHAERVLQD